MARRKCTRAYRKICRLPIKFFDRLTDLDFVADLLIITRVTKSVSDNCSQLEIGRETLDPWLNERADCESRKGFVFASRVNNTASETIATPFPIQQSVDVRRGSKATGRSTSVATKTVLNSRTENYAN